MTGTVLEPGTQVRFTQRTWTVVMLEGPSVRLIDADDSVATVLVNFLFAAPDFEVVGAPRRGVAPFGLLEELPQQVRERAYAWERHVREVETGLPAPGQAQVPRAEFDPAQRSMAEREAAKAAELTAAGQSASAVTVRRMRARYREQGDLPREEAAVLLRDAVNEGRITVLDYMTGQSTRLSETRRTFLAAARHALGNSDLG